jgi:hypothetical protein
MMIYKMSFKKILGDTLTYQKKFGSSYHQTHNLDGHIPENMDAS